MQRCSGIPCRAYLVLRSRDVSPAASPAISSGRCRHPPSVFRSLRALGCTGRTGAGTAANLKMFRNCNFLRN
ncbi:unnamed protein product [Staurois parvus]|uniref:Uncharacterized protein n=1 Tax=Staurois parvus TaxID=386267 RepID=A0ABN9E479_9NEOB|nr:unnamed protein product [Staurois parvus]